VVENDAYALLAVFLIPLGTAVLLMLVPSRERPKEVTVFNASRLTAAAAALTLFSGFRPAALKSRRLEDRVRRRRPATMRESAV